MQQNTVTTAFISTGIDGLDNILGGGLTRERLYRNVSMNLKHLG